MAENGKTIKFKAHIRRIATGTKKNGEPQWVYLLPIPIKTVMEHKLEANYLLEVKAEIAETGRTRSKGGEIQ